MSKLNKIKWFMRMLYYDGVPARTLTDGMDSVELYCILVLLERLVIYMNPKRHIPLELRIAIEHVKDRYCSTNRGFEKKRFKQLQDAYNEFTFKWEESPHIKDLY